jgi:dihydrofolate synthase/folylpolyglutamate synthase
MNSQPSTLEDWLALLELRHPVAIDLGLERVSEVWTRLGAPPPAARLITVAGTNGKGSTTAYLTSMLLSLSYRTGCYTSPHLNRYNERVQIQGQLVLDSDLLRAFSRIEAARGDISLSYFEFGTLAAFLLFAEARLDFAVIEVGLGGRLDATNILDTDCAVVTSIGLDHQEFLGHDIENIAYEKAGIFRAGVPAIIAEPDPPGNLLEQAHQRGAKMWRLGHEYHLRHQNNAYRYQQGRLEIELPQPYMPGLHQAQNMAAALTALLCLVPDASEHRVKLAEALSSVRLEGRLHASADCPRVWLDVAHNPHAASAIASTLLDLQIRPRICILGMLLGKDVAAVAKILNPLVDQFYCVGLQGSRGQKGSDLVIPVQAVTGLDRAEAFADVSKALDRALQQSGPDDNILVTGSFLTVSEASAFLSRNC